MNKKKEKKSLENGNLFIIDSSGKPIEGLSRIWFVWYREKNYQQYNIVLKSMKNNRKKVLEISNNLKEKLGIEYNVGLGFLNMFTGRMQLLKPEKEED